MMQRSAKIQSVYLQLAAAPAEADIFDENDLVRLQ